MHALHKPGASPTLPTNPRATRAPTNIWESCALRAPAGPLVPACHPPSSAAPPPSAAPALTYHLLQLVIVPVDGPRKGAGVLGHDGCTALGPPSNSLTSLFSSPRLSPPPTAAAAPPPTASGTATGRRRLAPGGRAAEQWGARSTRGPRLLLLRGRHSPARPRSRPRPPWQQLQELRLGPAPLSRPPPQPHARAKLSLLPPPADTQRADVTAPVTPRLGPASSRHFKCGWISSERVRNPRRKKLTVEGKKCFERSSTRASESQRRA